LYLTSMRRKCSNPCFEADAKKAARRSSYSLEVTDRAILF